MSLRWNFTDEPVDVKVIIGVEEILNVKFPDDYIKLAIDNHGGSVKPECIDIDGEHTKLGYIAFGRFRWQ